MKNANSAISHIFLNQLAAKVKKVYVVAWEYNTGGGFDWYHSQEDGDSAYGKELENCEFFNDENWTARQCIFVVPEGLSNHEITDHIETNQEVIWQPGFNGESIIDSGRAYSLVNCNDGSHRFGNCELCGKPADSVYHLVEFQRFVRKGGIFGLSHKVDIFGHKSCLSERTDLHSRVTIF